LLVGTGNHFDGGDYIGTAHVGAFVWHIYEVSLERTA
jgi:hypothetical protein